MKVIQNIGEDILIKKEYLRLGDSLRDRILKQEKTIANRVVIAVAGESGSGKSTTAAALALAFRNNDLTSEILHMDSYFKLPPKENHGNRLKNLKNVGPHEVQLDLLQDHIDAFRSGSLEITIPIVDYIKNVFTKHLLLLNNVEVLIVEGVYAFLLHDIDYRVFMSRTYHDTIKGRRERSRESYDPIVEEILEIEHQIVAPYVDQADFIVLKDYSLK